MIAVFGATGHTGRFVVSELLRRGLATQAVGRDAAALAACGFQDRGVTTTVSTMDDPASLDLALGGASVVINCAGPFLDTARQLIDAALRMRVHYLDVTAEQESARSTFERFHIPARERDVIVIPAAGFYGGLADLLATVSMGDWTEADDIEILTALDRWWPTTGTRRTGQRNTSPRLVLSQGRLEPLRTPSTPTQRAFPEPFGAQDAVELPFSETIVIARHLRVSNIRHYLNEAPLRDVRDPATPGPTADDERGRSKQLFLMEAIVRNGIAERRSIARGRDIYAFTAPLVVEAASRLRAGEFKRTGSLALGEAFDALDFLHALSPEHLTFEMNDYMPV